MTNQWARRLLNLLTAASAVVCVATCVLWVRGYWIYDRVTFRWSGYYCQIDLAEGRVGAGVRKYYLLLPAFRSEARTAHLTPGVYAKLSETNALPGGEHEPGWHARWLFKIETPRFWAGFDRRIRLRPEYDHWYEWWGWVAVPWWCWVSLSASLPVTRLLLLARRGRRCARGFDVRPTPA